MPSIVNELLNSELERKFEGAGSCLVVSFDGLNVADDTELRSQFREAGFEYQVVKNRLAVRAAKKVMDVDITEALGGKCAVVFAPEERAISAAKIVREAMQLKKKNPPMTVTGGVIEGAVITGAAAAAIADMPDRDTVRAMLAGVILAPARSLATAINAVGGGMARCVQAKTEQGGE